MDLFHRHLTHMDLFHQHRSPWNPRTDLGCGSVRDFFFVEKIRGAPNTDSFFGSLRTPHGFDTSPYMSFFLYVMYILVGSEA